MAEPIKPVPSIKPGSSTPADSRREIVTDEAREKPILPREAPGRARSVQQNALRASMPTAKDYMTPMPHFIASHEPISSARNRMQEYGIRHLLVLEEEKVVGVVSERDLAVVRGVAAQTEEASVDHVMTRDIYTAAGHTALNRVARGMVERKCGSAIVTDHGEVVGILTTIDALHALADALEGKDLRLQHEAEAEGQPRGIATRPPDRESRH